MAVPLFHVTGCIPVMLSSFTWHFKLVMMYRWDPEREPLPTSALADIDVVFHLAGEPVAEGRWTDDKRRRIRDSRVLGTRHLVDGMAHAAQRPKVLVAASAVGYYGDRGDAGGSRASGGARALASYLRSLDGPKPVFVFGAMRDKDVDGMLRVLLPAMASVIVTRPTNPRPSPRFGVIEICIGTPMGSCRAVSAPRTPAAIASRCGARRGCSAATVTSTFCTHQPSAATRDATSVSRPIDETPAYASSVAG